LECHQFLRPFSTLRNLVISVSHKVLFFQGGHYLQLQAELGLEPPPAVHGFPHTAHAVCTGFLSSQQLLWLYLPDDIVGLKGHEWQLVPLCCEE
jgi:hypothetical protein